MISGLTTRTQTEGDGSTIVFPFSDELQEASDLTAIYRDVNGVELTLANPADYTLVLTDGGANGGTITLVSIIPLADEYVTTVVKGTIGQDLDLTQAGGFPSAAIESAIDRVSLGVRYSTNDQDPRHLKLTEGAVVGQDHPFDALGHRISNGLAPTADSDYTTRGAVTNQINAAASLLTDVSTVTITAFMETLLDDADGDTGLQTLGVTAYFLDVVKAANLAASVSAQGMSAVVQAILQDNTAAEILTELGFSAYIQTLLNDADSATARATLEIDASVSHTNELCNGDFQIWQQGIQFTAAIPAAGGNDDDSYFADQWVLISDGNDVVDIDKVVGTTVRAKNAAQFTIATADTAWGCLQILDADTSQSLRDLVMSFSIEIEAPGDATLFEMHLVEWTGTADSPTTDPISAWNALTATPTLIENWAFVAGSTTSISATATSTTFKAENVTIPATVNNLGFLITTLDGAMAVSSVVTMSEVNWVRGSLSGVYRTNSKPQELLKCEQWYTKTFELEVFPVQNLGNDRGCLVDTAASDGGANGNVSVNWRFPTRMIQVPTVLTFNPTAAASSWDHIGVAGTITAATDTESESSVQVHGTTGSGAAGEDRYAIHATADARF